MATRHGAHQVDLGRALHPSRGPRGLVVRGAGLALAAGLALGACAAGSSGGSSSTTKAKSGLEAVVAAMQAATNFSFTGAVGPQRAPVHLSGQFTAPDREHLVVTAGNGTTTELVFAGGRAYVKSANGAWVDKLTGASAPVDPRKLFHTLDTASSVTVRHDGVASTYRFLLPSTSASALGGAPATSSSGDVSGTARVVDGRLVELTLRWGAIASPFEADVAYSKVGTTPPVVTPVVAP